MSAEDEPEAAVTTVFSRKHPFRIGVRFTLSVVPTGFMISREGAGLDGDRSSDHRRVGHSEELLLWALTELARLSCATAPGYEDWWPQWMQSNKAKVKAESFLDWAEKQREEA